jgi:transcriptional regulator with XRE-family HTH domain
MQNFPTRLAEAIAKSGKSKGALAATLGVALSTVSRWLGGTVPKAETLARIAAVLSVDAKWLLTGEIPLHPRWSPLEGLPNRSALTNGWDLLASLQEDPAAWRAAYDQIVSDAGVDLFQIAKATENLVRRAKVAIPLLAKVDSAKSSDLEDAIAKVENATADANDFSNLFHVLGELLYAIPAWLEIVNREKGSR